MRLREHDTALESLRMILGRNIKQAVKHWKIAALAGDYDAMHELRTRFEKAVSRESIDSTLKAYNKSCVEMRSEARDACIHAIITDTL